VRALQHPPEDLPYLRGDVVPATVLPGTGTVCSYGRPPLRSRRPQRRRAPPVVLVSLDSAPPASSAPRRNVEIGTPVGAVWLERVADDGTKILLPQWQRMKESG
jgi:hypothetical protein